VVPVSLVRKRESAKGEQVAITTVCAPRAVEERWRPIRRGKNREAFNIGPSFWSFQDRCPVSGDT